MAFPSSPVLDAFTDGSAPRNLPTYNASWSAPTLVEGTPQTTVGGGVKSGGAPPSSAHWTPVSLADVEVFATVVTKPADGSFLELTARVTTPGASVNGYALAAFAVAGADTVELWEFTAGFGSPVATVQTAEFAVGDQLGMSLIGNTIRLYKNGAQIGSPVTNSLHTGAGNIGVRFGDATGVLDNFGGGAPVVPARPDYSRFPKFLLRR